MKILHILDERWDSGLTAYGLALASALQSLGHRVHVAALPGRPAYEESGRRGLPVRPVGSALAFRRWVGREKFDVLNAHTGSGHFLGWLGALGRSAALIRTRGDARPLELARRHALVYRRTDAVIAASRSIGAQYKAAGADLAAKVRVVHPGLDVPPFAPEPAGPLRFALVGRLDPIKGQVYFLEAVAHLKESLTDQEFILAGEEKNTTVSGLKAYAEKCGVSRWVRFAGRVPDAGAFMASCHVGVICSIGSEAVSRACLEWMSRGRPVVATAVGCLPELVDTGDNGFLVPTHSPKSLADVFLGLIKNPDFRRDMGRRAHAAALSRFSLDRFARETERVYLEALARRR